MAGEKRQMMTCSFETVVTRSEMDSFRTNSRDFFFANLLLSGWFSSFCKVQCDLLQHGSQDLSLGFLPQPKAKGVLGTSLDWLETQTRKKQENVCRLRFLKKLRWLIGGCGVKHENLLPNELTRIKLSNYSI